MTDSFHGLNMLVENDSVTLQTGTGEKFILSTNDRLYTEYGGMSAAIGIVPVEAYIEFADGTSKCIFSWDVDEEMTDVSSLAVLDELKLFLKKVATEANCKFKE